MKNFLEKTVTRMDQQAEKRSDRKSNRIRQKNKRGDSNVGSNESPEVPDREETSHIPGLPSGVIHTALLCAMLTRHTPGNEN